MKPEEQGQQAPPSGSAVRQQAVAFVGSAVKLAQSNDRSDLVDRLTTTQRRLADPSIRVLIVGEYKQGKSSLVNGLVNAPVCPVDDDIATAVPTVIRYSDTPGAHLIREPQDGKDEEREQVSVEKVPQLVSEQGNPENALRLRSVEVGLPRDLLKPGLVLVDTPGVGGLASAHNLATMTALPFADAVIFVSDASQELTGPELEFLRTARELCPNIISALTKIDFYPEWRRIQKLDHEHLQAARIAAAVVPLSAVLRQRALRTEDRRLNAESGFPQLVQILRDQIVGVAERIVARSAANDMLVVLGQLATVYQSEKSVLTDPKQAEDVTLRLQKAKEDADHLRSAGAKWQQTLNDGFADLTSDVDYDFRVRIREVTQEADDSIEESDPAEIWEELQGWLQRRVAREVAENYAMLSTRAKELVERVAEHFAEAQPDLSFFAGVDAPRPVMEGLAVSTDLRPDKVNLVDHGLNLVRSSYGGVSMFGAIGNMAGLGLGMLNPFSIGVGVLLGGKALIDDRKRRLTQLRQQAKQAHRKYTEEVNLQVGKDSRDTLRRVQRDLRDSFAGIAEEVQRSTAEALQAAQTAAKIAQDERAKRLAAVDQQLKVIHDLRNRAAALAPDLAAQKPAGVPA